MTVTVINKFVVPEEQVDAFLDEFERHRSFLAARPGLRSGTIYRKTSGPGRFNLVNIARWENAETLEAARRAMGNHYAEQGSDPGAVYRKLGIEADIAVYAELENY